LGDKFIIRATRNSFIAIISVALGACSSSSPGGRFQMTAPSGVSAIYSETSMQMALVTEENVDSPCLEECEIDRAFEQSVQRLGSRLAQSAFEIYPELSSRFEKFTFTVAEKANPGSTSSAAASVLIFRGVQKLRLSEEALAFLIAREMGYVIGRHHDENTATSLLFSVLGSVLIPGIGLLGGSAVLAQAATTTVSSSVVTSAASFIGSKITIDSYKLEQLREADAIALNLLARLGWSRSDIADALVASTRVMDNDTWAMDLRASTEDVVRLVGTQNSINRVTVGNLNGEIIITVGLSHPIASLPVGFITESPPRIVLDFSNTTNDLGKSVQYFHEGDLLSTNIIQAAGRTRMSINLSRMLAYSTKIEDDKLLIILQSKAADAAETGSAKRFLEPAPIIVRQQSEVQIVEFKEQDPLNKKLKNKTKPGNTENYVIQVGIFSNAANAKREFEKLKKRGFKVHTEKIGNQTKLGVGPYTDRSKAEKALHLLEKSNLHPLLITESVKLKR
jgi:hypothetical protein